MSFKAIVVSCFVFAFCSVGCAHQLPMYYTPPAPPVATVVAPTHSQQVVEYPCGHELVVHVGNADVKLPKLNVILGAEGSLASDGYVLHLEDAEFRTREYCQRVSSQSDLPNERN